MIGILLVVLGAWGALIPLVGPYAHFGYTPDTAFHLDAGRLVLEILPGAAAAIGGLLLLVAANRLVASFGAWLAVAAGAWLAVGPTLQALLHLGSPGRPIHTSTVGSTLETLLLFPGIGVLIAVLGAIAVGRLGVVSVHDVRAARDREHDRREAHARESDAGGTDRHHVYNPGPDAGQSPADHSGPPINERGRGATASDAPRP